MAINGRTLVTPFTTLPVRAGLTAQSCYAFFAVIC